ncbi:hypothetical protein [Bacillus pseudomycoides]|uniref:hypothetical protein n=1 Tax=Bacillus pseudomycoides TaxID=64104 RepID=UPI000372C6D0|nr:hypothetical protein [Bacillus pseudomycoides]
MGFFSGLIYGKSYLCYKVKLPSAEYTLKPGSVVAGVVNKTINSPFAQFWQGSGYWDTATKVKPSSTSTGAIKTDDLKLIRSDVLEK